MSIDDLINCCRPATADIGDPPRFCTCDELLVGRHRVPIMRFHDCDYVRRRNALIPQASKIASERVHVSSGDENNDLKTKWTRQFSITMDELSAPLLRNGS